jgi:hypothetical protein
LKVQELKIKNKNTTSSNDTKKKKAKSKEKEAIEPLAKFLKEEKTEILNSLNCTNEVNFVIHVFKNFDKNHLYISIPKYEEFNSTKIEDWVSTAVDFSVKKLTLNSIKEIYNTEKPALIYIDKPFNRKTTYLTNEIEDDYELPENKVFKALQAKSFIEQKNFLFLLAQENDFSTQLVLDLFDIRVNSATPIILGLRFNIENKNFVKRVLTTQANDLNETEASIDNFIKKHKRNILNEEDFQYEQSFVEAERQIKNPKFTSNEKDEYKYEIYMIDYINYQKTISARSEELIYVLLTYKRKLETEVIYRLFFSSRKNSNKIIF